MQRLWKKDSFLSSLLPHQILSSTDVFLPRSEQEYHHTFTTALNKSNHHNIYHALVQSNVLKKDSLLYYKFLSNYHFNFNVNNVNPIRVSTSLKNAPLSNILRVKSANTINLHFTLFRQPKMSQPLCAHNIPPLHTIHTNTQEREKHISASRTQYSYINNCSILIFIPSINDLS